VAAKSDRRVCRKAWFYIEEVNLEGNKFLSASVGNLYAIDTASGIQSIQENLGRDQAQKDP